MWLHWSRNCRNARESISLVTAKGDTMHSGPTRAATEPHKVDFIGDHLAINFINTLRTPLGEPFEVFKTDEDVKDWLLRAGVSTPSGTAKWPAGTLVQKARQLREIALKAVLARKAGKRISLDALNSFLEHATSYPQLVKRSGSKIEIKKIYSGRIVEEFLASIAESVADLLVNEDFELIRQCAGTTCVLWFYDRTKAHRRRWCSPTGCGNRAKVAAFRARSHEHAQAN
jgi:predicted RNA-binding Zn ribbon-like protein